jgi:hypothetical protein
MGSSFEASFLAEALPDLLTEFGQASSVSRASVTITPTVIVDMQEVRTRETVSSRSGEMQISRNWVILLIPTAQYDFGSGAVEPSPVDEIVIGSRKYEPRKPEGKGQCWEYTDGTSQVYKIFVEEVST